MAMASPTMHKLNSLRQNINSTNLAAVLKKSVDTANAWRVRGVKTYHYARLFFMGPVRNSLAVGREFLSIVAKERQFVLPDKQLWSFAKSEYVLHFERVFPAAVRQQGRWVDTLRAHFAELTWKQVGSGLLVVGEIISLFYLSKLVVLGARKTVGLLVL